VAIKRKPTQPSTASPRELEQRIYTVVAQIPRGKVATYGWVAERAGLVRGARRVGYALRMLPAGKHIPWHRVVNAQGRISLPATSTAAKRQRQRLHQEGIVFRRNRIDLKRFGWRVSLDELLWRLP
jgi:methylated-DNA-protein-cysteine methyltransferase related protein